MAQVRGKNTNMAKKNSRKANLVREISFWIMAVFVSVLFAICVGRFLPDIGNAFSRKIGESALEKGFLRLLDIAIARSVAAGSATKTADPFLTTVGWPASLR